MGGTSAAHTVHDVPLQQNALALLPLLDLGLMADACAEIPGLVHDVEGLGPGLGRRVVTFLLDVRGSFIAQHRGRLAPLSRHQGRTGQRQRLMLQQSIVRIVAVAAAAPAAATVAAGEGA